MADITQFTQNATIHLHRNDLPPGVTLGPVVAVDTETMGLNPHRDRLCLVQLSAGDGVRIWCRSSPTASAAMARTARTCAACWPTPRW